MEASVRQLAKTKPFAYLIITTAAILYICGLQAIMQVAHVLSSDLDAIPLVVTLLMPKLLPYYGLLYLAINIPFVIVFYKKLPRTFMIRTIYFLFVSTAFSTLFFIHDVASWFETLIVKPQHGMSVAENVVDNIWPMLVLPIIGGAVVGIAMALAWKYGGSSGGADMVVFHYSNKRKIHVGSVMFIVSLVIVIISFAVLISIQDEVRKAWLPSLVGSLIYIAVLSLTVNIIFPKYSKMQVEIHPTQMAAVLEYLKTKHNHPFRLETAKSGYTGKDITFITTVILLLEVKSFMKAIEEIDNRAWVSAINVSQVVGRFNTKSVDHN